jgi:adenylate cyclase
VDGSAPLRSAVSLLSILKPRDKRTPERSSKGRAQTWPRFLPRIVEQLVDVDVPFSVARRQPTAILFRRLDLPRTHPAILRDLLGILSESVLSHHGSIDKFLGNALLAFFGSLTSVRDATNAAACSLRFPNRSIAGMKTRPFLPTGRAHRCWPPLRRGRSGRCWQRETART